MHQVTVSNPVADGYFADPFVLRTHGAWYAYGTGPEGNAAVTSSRGMAFEIRRSDDFATWRTVGHALRTPDLPLPADPAEQRKWWAPEVIALGDRLYLYYSTGIEDRGH